MSILMHINPFEFFVDTAGTALDGGYIWIGQANQDPRNYPVTVYYDEALTIPASMPLRTTNGYIYRNGSPTFLYINGNYSILVEDKNHRQIYYVPDFLMTGNSGAVAIDDLTSISGGLLVGNPTNIAELRLVTKPSSTRQAPYILTIAGYYTKGDGGEGSFWLDALDATSTDNGVTIIVSNDGGRWKLIHDGEISVKQAGAKGDGVTDDSLRIQAAIDTGIPLWVPAATYGMALSQNITLEGGATACSLIAKTGLVMRGAGIGRAVFKILDNQSTDLSPKVFNLMAGNTIIRNLSVSGITFDINGQNNKISPNRGTGVYSSANTAGIFISGRASVVGVDAQLIDSKIFDCEFINGPGVTCIATGQQEASAVLSSNVEIYGCRFYNNGIDSQDHSSVYMWGNNINVHDCVFSHPTLSTGQLGPVVAAELHGSENFFCNNIVTNYCQGVWISGNQTTPSVGMTVSNNSFSVSWVGIGLFSINPISLGLQDVLISGNRIWIKSGTLTNPGLTFSKTGMLLAMTNGELDRMVVTGNSIRCTDATNNIGILVSANSGAFVVDALIEGNQVSGFSRGIAVGLGATGAVFDINMKSNNICNMTPSASLALTQGIHVSGALGKISISENEISGSASHPNQCIYLGTFGGSATLDSLFMANNSLDANAAFGIVDTMIVAGQRAGLQATTFAALPTQSTWKVGDPATSATKPRAGVAPNQYKMVGWVRETNGTANVLNVDWFEQRIPCGV